MTTGTDRIARSPAGATPRALAAAFVTLVVLVGINIVAIRSSNRELAPFWNAGLRFALAAIAFAVIAAVRRTPLPDRRAVRDGAVYGLLAFAAFFGFLYLGLVRVPAGLGQVVLALGPLITFVMAVIVRLERFRWRPVVGGLVALAGIAVMYGVDARADVPFISLLSIAAAAVSFAAGGIAVKRMGTGDPVVRNAIATAVGSVVLLAISRAIGETWALPRQEPTIVAFVYLVLPGTVVIFMLFLLLLRNWPATLVSTQFVLAPIVGITLGALLLNEQVSPPTIVGAALVLGGVWFGALRGGS